MRYTNLKGYEIMKFIKFYIKSWKKIWGKFWVIDEKYFITMKFVICLRISFENPQKNYN